MRYFLGVDGGGSGTRAVVLSDVLEVIGQGEAGPSNHYVAGLDGAVEACWQAAEAALFDAKRIEPDFTRDQIASWGLGLAGVRREDDSARMRERLAMRIRAPFVLDHDAAAAQSGAFGGEEGIVFSAGTGSICFGVDDRGDRFFAGGWGSVLGDEGSGYWIGQQALRAVCRAADGRGPQTRLTQPILNALNCRTADDLVRLVYSPLFTRDAMAQLAKIVFEVASHGSREACVIRDAAARHAANSILTVARAMMQRARERAEPDQPAPMDIGLAFRGGLFQSDDFRAAVGYAAGEGFVGLKQDYWPVGSWRVVKPQYDAAVGAALLAQKAHR